MSQVPTPVCPNCNTPIGSSQPYCPRCGAKLISTGNTVAPTMAVSSGSWQPSTPGQPNTGGGVPPTMAASSGSWQPSTPGQPHTGGGIAPTMAASSGSWQQENGGGGYNSAPPPPIGLPNSSYGSPSGYPSAGYDPYAGGSAPSFPAPPPPPTDPYGGSAQPNPYAASGQPGQYMSPPPSYMPTTKKKAPVLYIVLGILAAVLVVCGGSTWAVIKADSSTGGSGSNNGTTSGGQFAASQNVNLQVVYSSDQITFTSIQQGSKFSDDSFTGLAYENKNYVRVNFKEQQLANKTSYFSYNSAFMLILPDKSTASALQAQENEGPQSGVVRTNWVDFELSKQVDLSQLSLRLGSTEEAQMTFPLKTGADVSKYNPQKVTPNQAFQYANMNWTLNDATQSYYNNGQQAKTGKVIVVIDLTANNPSSNGTVYLDSSFIRLKSGATVSAPNYDSSLTNFDIIDAGTSNIQGTAVFDTPPSSTYTLEFASGQNITAQSLNLTIGSGS